MLAPLLLVGCAPSTPPLNPPGATGDGAMSTDPSQELSAPEPLVAVAPPAVLTPLPTTAQVQDSVSRGRVDPFAPVGSVAGAGSSSVGVFSLQGVMAVGSEVQALVLTTGGSGAICVGPGGRCRGSQGPGLLPTEWTVVSIDPQRGCLTYTVENKPQAPVCLADGSSAKV